MNKEELTTALDDINETMHIKEAALWDLEPDLDQSTFHNIYDHITMATNEAILKVVHTYFSYDQRNTCD